MLTSIKRVVKRRLAALAANVLTDVLRRESSHQLFDISSERQRHVLGAHPSREPKLTGPYTYEHSFHEPMVFFGFLAAITTRLELVTGILILPQRQTVLVAKQTAEVDVLSGGRLRLGIGIGWNYVEYDALGESFQTRGRRVEEQIEVLRKVWTQPLVTYKTTHHVIDNAGINPLPIRRPIPIWSGVPRSPGSGVPRGSGMAGCRPGDRRTIA